MYSSSNNKAFFNVFPPYSTFNLVFSQIFLTIPKLKRKSLFVCFNKRKYLCDRNYLTNESETICKWVGGKTQLIDQLEAMLPADFDQWENVTYIEPFVGGGAML